MNSGTRGNDIHCARVVAYLKAFIDPGPSKSRLHRLSSHKSVYVSSHEKSSTYHVFQSKNLDSIDSNLDETKRVIKSGWC